MAGQRRRRQSLIGVEGFLALYDRDTGKFKISGEQGARMSRGAASGGGRAIPLQIDHQGPPSQGAVEGGRIGTVCAVRHIPGKGLFARALIDGPGFLALAQELARRRGESVTGLLSFLFPSFSMSSRGDEIIHVALVGVGQRRGTLVRYHDNEDGPHQAGQVNARRAATGPGTTSWPLEGDELSLRLIMALLDQKRLSPQCQKILFEDARMLKGNHGEFLLASMRHHAGKPNLERGERESGKKEDHRAEDDNRADESQSKNLVCKLLEILLDQQRGRTTEEGTKNFKGGKSRGKRPLAGKDIRRQRSGEDNDQDDDDGDKDNHHHHSRRLCRHDDDDDNEDDDDDDYDEEDRPKRRRRNARGGEGRVMSKLLDIEAALKGREQRQGPRGQGYRDELKRVLASVQQEFSEAANAGATDTEVKKLECRVKDLDEKLESFAKQLPAPPQTPPPTMTTPPPASTSPPCVEACLAPACPPDGVGGAGLLQQSFDRHQEAAERVKAASVASKMACPE